MGPIVGCAGAQSALAPAGRDAERLARMFMWMTAGSVVIWVAVIAVALWARHWSDVHAERSGRALILGGGVVFPLIVLTGLLLFGVADLPATLAPGHDRITIEVTGRQWWWRVRYVEPGYEPVELANEIRLPVGRRIDTRLRSDDVIHSFWVPALTGKMDMIPGRTNRLALEATRTGVFRGACAEYCGLAHARMNLAAVVVQSGEFEQWLRAQRAPARPSTDPVAQRGAAEFMTRGCSVCHTIRGTTAVGRLGPDLTHVGSRLTLAAGLLENDREQLVRWITHTELLKPGVHMPTFASVPPPVVDALATYLSELQ
jgi:cytochrome c oxidase subunit II